MLDYMNDIIFCTKILPSNSLATIPASLAKNSFPSFLNIVDIGFLKLLNLKTLCSKCLRNPHQNLKITINKKIKHANKSKL